MVDSSFPDGALMSLNVTVVTWDYVACVTDRRLTNGATIISERSNKLIQLVCRTAQCVITYNGIGCDPNGITPRDWVSGIEDLDRLTLADLSERIKEVSETNIAKLMDAFGGNPRHTFVIGAFESGRPVLGMVSNYESFAGSAPAKTFRPRMSIELMSPNRNDSIGAFIITGATNLVKKRSRDVLIAALQARLPSKTVLPLMKKVIRDTSYAARLNGSVGSSVASTILSRGGGFEWGTSIVGGSSLMEIPDILFPNLKMRDIWISTEMTEEKFKSWYDPVLGKSVIAEPRCARCGTPVPDGYRRCGACDTFV